MVALPLSIFRKEAERWNRLLTSSNGKRRRPPRLSFADKSKSIQRKLTYLYGEKAGTETFAQIEKKMRAFIRDKPTKLKNRDAHFVPVDRFTQKDTVFITYPDSFTEQGSLPLSALHHFAKQYLAGSINAVHILPFHPSSSDRGFSVVTYTRVEPTFGKWSNINHISQDFTLMVDSVLNHVSVKSKWFQRFLAGDPEYINYFISYQHRNEISPEQMKKILRPRTSDLLTEFQTSEGKRYVWTTFSKDQADLNYREPKVLLRMIDVMTREIKNGAHYLRFDAATYIWKELGTSCASLRQTHVIVQLFRDILDIVAPSVSVITETNIPHAQNISYFGNGRNEAQMVYNFALPTLVLYTLYRADATYLSNWAAKLSYPSPYSSYFNFLDSHDGVGLSGVRRVLPEKEVRYLIREAKNRGSLANYKKMGSGTEQEYELNITWWSALKGKGTLMNIKRYIASRAIALSLKGMPAIYVNGLLASASDLDGARKGENRDINRKRIDLVWLRNELKNRNITSRVYARYCKLLRIRATLKSFHPSADQKILRAQSGVFSLLRTSLDQKEKVLVLINVTDKAQEFAVDVTELGLHSTSLYDPIGKKLLVLVAGNVRIKEFALTLQPYQVMWLRSTDPRAG